jgi:hypothetical protein
LREATPPVIPGRCEASNPESRDSGSGAGALSRDDEFWIASSQVLLAMTAVI